MNVLWLEFRFSLLSPLVIRFAPTFDTRAASSVERSEIRNIGTSVNELSPGERKGGAINCAGF